MPVIILGGTWPGCFTPTEAAAVAAAYGWFVSMMIDKDLRPRELPALLLAPPLLVPLSVPFHSDPVQLGPIMTCKLAIGLYRPPVGGTLMVGARLAGTGMGAVVKHLIILPTPRAGQALF